MFIQIGCMSINTFFNELTQFCHSQSVCLWLFHREPKLRQILDLEYYDLSLYSFNYFLNNFIKNHNSFVSKFYIDENGASSIQNLSYLPKNFLMQNNLSIPFLVINTVHGWLHFPKGIVILICVFMALFHLFCKGMLPVEIM